MKLPAEISCSTCQAGWQDEKMMKRLQCNRLEAEELKRGRIRDAGKVLVVTDRRQTQERVLR